MIEALHHVILKGHVFVYLDDIIIHSPNIEEHLKTLEEVFDALEKVNLAVKPSKCKLFRESIKYLGHMVDKNGCRPVENSVVAIQKLARPTTVKGVRSFLGSLNFYRKFVENFAEIAAPLYEFLKKRNTLITWNEKAEVAFQTLKEKLTTAPLLAFPKFDQPFVIKTDASLSALGAVLEQTNDFGEYQPIAYASRRLNKAERNYAVIEREALAIVFALDHFKHMTFGNKILLLTDHKPLIYLNELKDTNSRVARWMINIQSNNIEIQHIPGKLNSLADLLSRNHDEDEINTCAVNVNNRIITVQLVKEQQDSDDFCINIKNKIKNGETDNDTWTIDENDILIKKVQLGKSNLWAYRTVIPKSLINDVLVLYHDSICGGHFSLDKTIYRIKRVFTWEGIFSDIKTYINTCEKCQRRNRNRIKAPIQAVTPPTGCMAKLSIDILGPFGTTQKRNKYIITYTDHFSRMTFASALPNQEAHTIAKDYIENIYTRYGGSGSILSDRGPQLVGRIMSTLCERLGIERITSTPYWPRSNGVSERINTKILNLISHYCNKNYSDWDVMLPYLIQVINNTVHRSTNQVPFYIFHGFYQYDVFTEFNLTDNEDNLDRVELVDAIMEKLERAKAEVFSNLESASINNARGKDRGRKLREFNIGDCVLALDVPSYTGHNRKLNPRYTGPYTVIKRTGLANYQIRDIKNPNTIKKVHVDKIKLYNAREYIDDDDQGDRRVTPDIGDTGVKQGGVPYVSFPDDEIDDKIEEGALTDFEIIQYEDYLRSLQNKTDDSDDNSSKSGSIDEEEGACFLDTESQMVRSDYFLRSRKDIPH